MGSDERKMECAWDSDDGTPEKCCNCFRLFAEHKRFSLWGLVTHWCPREHWRPREDVKLMSDDKNSPESRDETTQSTPLAAPPVTRKLDLACGQRPREGYEGVDIWPGAQHLVNLQTYPWPFADASVLELNCSHYIEHIPMETISVHHQDMRSRPYDSQLGKDALFAFFDECYRILVPDGWLHLVWPACSNDRAFQDPTHRRFIPQETMLYMRDDWRRLNGLDHYSVECNFVGSCDPVIDQSLALRASEVVQQRLRYYRNVAIDLVAHLQKQPRLTRNP